MSLKTLGIVVTLVAFAVPAFAGENIVILGNQAQTQAAGGQYPQINYGDVKYYPPTQAQVQAQGGNYQQLQYNNKPVFMPYTPNQQVVSNQQSQVFQVAPAPSQLYTYQYNFAFNSVSEYQKWQTQMNQYCQQNRVRVQVYNPRGVYTPPVQYPQQQRYDHLNQYDLQYYQSQQQYQLELQRMQYQQQWQQQQLQFQREEIERQRRAEEQARRDQRNIAMASMFGQMIPMFVIMSQNNRNY